MQLLLLVIQKDSIGKLKNPGSITGIEPWKGGGATDKKHVTRWCRDVMNRCYLVMLSKL